MPDIKTKDVVLGTIKTLDRTAMAAQRMKDAYIQTKHKAEHSVYSSESNTEEYAADQMMDAVSTVTHEAVHQVDVQGQKMIQSAQRKHVQKRKAEKAKSQSAQDSPQPIHDAPPPNSSHPVQNTAGAGNIPHAQQPHRVSPDGAVPPKRESICNKQIGNANAKTKAKQPSKRIVSSVSQGRDLPSVTSHRNTAIKPHGPAGKTIKTVERTGEVIKQSARSAGRATIKAPGKTIKTASSTVKSAKQVGSTSVKTAQITFKVAQKTAIKSAKTAQRIRTTAKAAATTAKALARATAKTIKAIIAAAQKLITAIIAAGWVAIMVIVIILMVGLIVGSCFGIFFSSQDSRGGKPMSDVVQEINTEYQRQLNELRKIINHDEVEMSGSRAAWREVLSIYAVMVTTDPNNSMEVSTIDNTKKIILEQIFWQMNKTTYKLETRKIMELIETDDGNGNIVEVWTEVTKDYLLITVEHKTAEEMADVLGFTAEQKELLAQLLSEEYDSLWLSVLYGIDAGDAMIVKVAISQIGNIGGQPYWSWYGFESRVEWCACFVSWCANECGYIDAGIIPKFAGCINGVQWFKDRGQWTDNSAEPIPGMIIFFDWENESDGGGLDGLADHVGIVEKVENGRVYTIEGNTSDSCLERSYPLGHHEILGYGIPAY